MVISSNIASASFLLPNFNSLKAKEYLSSISDFVLTNIYYSLISQHKATLDFFMLGSGLTR